MNITVFSVLTRCETRLWNQIEAALKNGSDLSLAQFEVLDAIVDDPDAKACDIAAELDITTGGISKVIDKLVTKGHIERVPGCTDRRINVLSITDQGRRAHREAQQIVCTAAQQALSGAFTAQEIRDLDSTLTRLLDALR